MRNLISLSRHRVKFHFLLARESLNQTDVIVNEPIEHRVSRRCFVRLKPRPSADIVIEHLHSPVLRRPSRTMLAVVSRAASTSRLPVQRAATSTLLLT